MRPRNAAELAQLGLRATGAGVGHHVERVLFVEHVEHELGHLVGRARPGVDDLVVALEAR